MTRSKGSCAEPNWLLQAARSRPDHAAWQIEGAVETYAELAARAQRLAGQLVRAGLRAGERVAIWSDDPGGIGLVLHASSGLGCPLVILHPRLRASELAPLLELARPRLLVHTSTSQPGAARETGTDHATGTGLAAMDWPDGPTPWSLDALQALDPLETRLLERLDPSRDHTVLFTSGTTGRSKGVRLGLAQHLASAQANRARLGLSRDDRWLLCMPPYHVGGLAILLRSVLFASTVLLQRRFDAAAVWRELDAGRVTHVSLVPTMLARLLEHVPDLRPPATLRCVLLGGGPIPDDLAERALGLGWPLACTYGLTEAASSVATGRLGERTDRSWLPPLPGTRVRVVSDDGLPLPPHSVGEVWVRGPQVMLGYLNDDDATRAALHGGWLRTGDLGELDARGHLRVHDRRTDLIVSGGENVYPAEIEAVLDLHPCVKESAVLAAPDPRWGQRGIAWIVPTRSPGTPDLERALGDELRRHCRAELAPFKCPAEFVFREEPLPRTASGKLRRTELRTQVKP